MESKDELKEIDFKYCTYYLFDDVIRDIDIDFDNFYLTKKHKKISSKIFKFMTFHAKLLWVPNHCAVGSIK